MDPPDEIRYGILARDRSFPGWQARCLQHLDDVDGARLQLLIQRDEEPSDPDPAAGETGSRGVRRSDPLSTGRLWERVRGWLAPGTPATDRVSMVGRLGGVETLRCRPDGPVPGRFHPDDVERIREHDLDFILRLDDGAVRGPILRVPTYGVWAFRHGDPNRHPPGPPGFWEILRSDPVTAAVLQRLTPDPGAVEVLHRGSFRTVDDSWVQNRNQILVGSAPWPARVCREILVGARTPRTVTPATRQIRAPERPDVRHTLGLLWKLAQNYVRNLGAELFRHEQWSIGTVARPLESFVESGEDLSVRWLSAPSRDHYRADPFGFQVDGTLEVLAEELDYAGERGRLVSLQIGRDGRPRSPELRGFADMKKSAPERTKIEEAGRAEDGTEASTTDTDGASGGVSLPRGMPAERDGIVHVSYPYLFRHQGDTYCVPETCGVRAVRLYRALDFPSEWETAATLVDDFAAVDPTIFRHDDRWWLFCTDLDEGSHTHLHAWWASDLFGPWTPHALNPLKTDVRSSRPAGTPFHHHGALFRPAQDCSETYGGAIALNRVVALSPDRFQEATIGFLKPDPDGPYPDGLHTLSAAGDRTLVDGKRYVFIPEVFRRRLGIRIRSVLDRWMPGTEDPRREETGPAPGVTDGLRTEGSAARDGGGRAGAPQPSEREAGLSRRPPPGSKPSKDEDVARRSASSGE